MDGKSVSPLTAGDGGFCLLGAAAAVAGGVAIGVVEGGAIGAVDGGATGMAGGVAAGRANNSKSLTKIGIEATGDSAGCDWAKLREIPKAEVNTKKTKIRMAQANFPCRSGEKNMRDSAGQVSLQNTRGPGRKRMKSACFVLTLVGRVSLPAGPTAAIGGEPDAYEPLKL
jgi:hypothetical protein